jgi:hypothetical protein
MRFPGSACWVSHREGPSVEYRVMSRGGWIRTRDLRVMRRLLGVPYMHVCRAFMILPRVVSGKICLFRYTVCDTACGTSAGLSTLDHVGELTERQPRQRDRGPEFLISKPSSPYKSGGFPGLESRCRKSSQDVLGEVPRCPCVLPGERT